MNRLVNLFLVALSIGKIAALPFPSYDKSDALNYVYYAYSAYCPPSALSSWSCCFCKGNTVGFQATAYLSGNFYDTHVFVGYHTARKEIIVSFRGTVPTSIANWLDDIVYLQVNGPFNGTSVKVHAGFLQSYQSVSSGVLSQVMSLTSKFPDYNLVLTGHSLGAAQVTLLAMDLAYNYGMKNAYLVTFGSPRVGNPAFAVAFNNVYASRTWRITHDHDIVPHVPLQNMLTNTYHHVGAEVWYQDNGAVTVCNNDGEDPNCSNGNFFDTSIPDHLTYLGVLFIVCLK